MGSPTTHRVDTLKVTTIEGGEEVSFFTSCNITHILYYRSSAMLYLITLLEAGIYGPGFTTLRPKAEDLRKKNHKLA